MKLTALKKSPYTIFFIIGFLYTAIQLISYFYIQPTLNNYYCLELNGRCNHMDYLESDPVYYPQENVNVWFLKLPGMVLPLLLLTIIVSLLKQVGVNKLGYRILLGIILYIGLILLTILLFNINPIIFLLLPIFFTILCSVVYKVFLLNQKKSPALGV